MIDEITVVNSHLRGLLDSDGLSILTLDLLLSGEGGGEPPPVPADGVVFKGAVVEPATPSGLVRASFNGILVAEAGGGPGFVGPVEVAAEGRLAGRVSATLLPGRATKPCCISPKGMRSRGIFPTGASGQVIVSEAIAELRWAGAHLWFGAVAAAKRQSVPARLSLRYDGASLEDSLGPPARRRASMRPARSAQLFWDMSWQ